MMIAAALMVLLAAWMFLSVLGAGCTPAPADGTERPPAQGEGRMAAPAPADDRALSRGSAASARRRWAAGTEAAIRLLPYPADLGPRNIGVDPGRLPDAERGGYSLVLSRCGRCHTPARALNHRYAEPEGRDVPDKEAAIASLKQEHPEFFKEPFIWQVEADVWKLCVSRMAAKPLSAIGEGDQRAIRLFLSWDSTRRKLGKKASEWKAHRQSLLNRFKARDPSRYAELEESDSL